MTASLSYSDYPAFLAALKDRVLQARTSAARAVNREMILLYWDIGHSIVEKQRKAGWDESVVERIAADLRAAFPNMRGFSARNMRDMKRFSLAFSDEAIWPRVVAKLPAGSEGEILQQPVAESGAKSKRPQAVANTSGRQVTAFLLRLVAEVPWGPHVVLLGKLTDPAARLYYLRATTRFGWSRNVLLHQIKGQAYERAVLEKKAHNFPLALPKYSPNRRTR
jgi:predicted nuclease of restriction endonuclease-like (RecB) superfamily